MPIHATSGGGVQWGGHGKVYHGKNARAKAEAQAAAAHANGFRGDEGHSSYLPSPEPRADAAKSQCAGILFLREGQVLLLHRKDRDEWEGPGGHVEEGETPVQTALRECAEETGLDVQVEPRELDVTAGNGGAYTTFAVHVNGELPLTLNHEHDQAAWFDIGRLPKAAHPGVAHALSKLSKRRMDAKLPTETEVIEKLKRGELDSPVRFGPLWLFRMRVTGTGIAYRPQHKEFVYRPPRFWLTKEMLRRVDGIPLLAPHSDDGPVKGEEYHLKNIGILVHPWIDKDAGDVWGIGKVYDDIDAARIVNKFPSTSPSVSFAPDDPGEYVKLDTGETLFIESNPFYIDHLAVVPEGVWDKFDGPTGIHFDSLERSDCNATGASPPYSWRR